MKSCPDLCIQIRSALLDQGQRNANLLIFSNTNELNGTSNIHYSESEVEKK